MTFFLIYLVKRRGLALLVAERLAVVAGAGWLAGYNDSCGGYLDLHSKRRGVEMIFLGCFEF